MSQETITDLNQNTLIGFTEKRGTAWHYRAAQQGEKSNHYEGAIPVEDVIERLFPWKAIEGDLVSTAITEGGVLTVRDTTRKTILRPDTGAILNVPKKGYKIHQYDEWLIEKVTTALDDDLSIASAGLLKGGGVAWVTVEVPDNIVTPEGVEFRPFILAATAHDGSLSSTYKRAIQLPVCDNTLSIALGEASETLKIKHTRNSEVSPKALKDALGVIYSTADEFQKEVAALTSVKVSDAEFQAFLDSLAPVPDEEGVEERLELNKQDTLRTLWNGDPRVAPWKGTAWGVLQAMNTAQHHEFTVRGMERSERNMLNVVTGETDKADRATVKLLNEVLMAA